MLVIVIQFIIKIANLTIKKYSINSYCSRLTIFMNEYPIFNGRASVSAIMEDVNGKVFTVVDYLTIDQEKAININFLDLISEPKREKAQKDLEARMKRAVIPMRLDPSLIDGAEIRTRYAQINTGNGVMKKTYEIEVIRGRSQANGGIFATIGELDGPRHTSFRYIKVLDN